MQNTLPPETNVSAAVHAKTHAKRGFPTSKDAPNRNVLASDLHKTCTVLTVAIDGRRAPYSGNAVPIWEPLILKGLGSSSYNPFPAFIRLQSDRTGVINVSG